MTQASGAWLVGYPELPKLCRFLPLLSILPSCPPLPPHAGTHLLRFLQTIVHIVVPEHDANTREAISLYNSAERELVLCFNVSNRLPGTFNMACFAINNGFTLELGTWTRLEMTEPK